MKNFRKLGILFLCAISFVPLSSRAAELDYPELVVAPRASERLQMELPREKARFTNQIPLYVAGVTTMASGFLYDPKNGDKRLGMGVAAIGAGWIGVGTLMALFYHPYEDGLADIADLPKGSNREKLVRERIAENSIVKAGKLGSKVAWASAITNALGSGLVAATSNSMGMSQILGLVGVVTAFAPVVFSYRWTTVSCEQQEYKKKIYGPLTSIQTSPFFTLENNGMNPKTQSTLAYGLAFGTRF